MFMGSFARTLKTEKRTLVCAKPGPLIAAWFQAIPFAVLKFDIDKSQLQQLLILRKRWLSLMVQPWLLEVLVL